MLHCDSTATRYSQTRREDPRIARVLRHAIGNARSLLNVGAGSGSYEPSDLEVLAIEPSETLIRQRAIGAAPVIQARAEAIPLDDKSYDVALAVNTVHHWTDLRAGLRELRRVCRHRIVIFLRDPSKGTPFWLTEDYLPALAPIAYMSKVTATLEAELGKMATIEAALPHDCLDGSFCGYWARPESYLDPEVRRNISNFSMADSLYVAQGIEKLNRDLSSGDWDRKHGHLRALPELDCGHRILVAELTEA